MSVRRAHPYHSVVLHATLGLAQRLNPAIKGHFSNNGHSLTLYNIPESDIGQIEIVTPDGKSDQNIHFERLVVYFANQSIVDSIRVYGLNEIVAQTQRQEEARAYTKLSAGETTFKPFLNLDIPKLTDDLSEIGNKLGVSQNTRGIPKVYSLRLSNDSTEPIGPNGIYHPTTATTTTATAAPAATTTYTPLQMAGMPGIVPPGTPM